ncbi:UDP-N-acetylmuramate dehydrogenase [Kutzneria viridogrisea]|uniref:UDP-N-acetylenolpyruvoylglucosamine reductase n=1 Tax=Kutzneria viridogrisea TaxID=47990 RepID=A0ABR6BK39_9PSEU|nr:UDP-N-acetylmuramate dehydrogenase [Kutzneria viridogrisea]
MIKQSAPALDTDVPLRPLTTLGVGGNADRLLRVTSADDLVEYAAGMAADEPPPLLLGHGSNVVVSDSGFPGTVALMCGGGIEPRSGAGDRVEVVVDAGESLERLVRFAVDEGLAGVECLAGVPGTVGALPVQNVGAYGQDVSQILLHADVLDWRTGRRGRMTARECEFGYRDSRFKREPGRYAVLSVTLGLHRRGLGEPVAYQQLADELGIAVGDRVRLAEVEAAVLTIRRRKGMVVDPADPDSRSVGSFFLNPTIPLPDWDAFSERLLAATGRRPPHLADVGDSVRTSAGWLIEQAGFTRGQRFGTARISTKHTLALVAEEGTKASDIWLAAGTIVNRVHDMCGVRLHPEPRFVGPFDEYPTPGGDGRHA